MRIAVVNTKGGTGKTTTSLYLAAGLARLGRTLVIDADPQRSAMQWWAAGDRFPFPVISQDTPRLHVVAADLARGYEHVVIDTPPAHEPIIRSAVLAASVVVIPASPTGLDVDRILPTIRMLSEVEVSHPQLEAGVLLTKVRKGTVSAREVRPVLEEMGLPVLDTEIPLAEMYAASFGSVPEDLGPYDDLVKELTSGN